ncbi:MAG: hypothetical protein JWR25_1422 [Noviherbaspirillum sp.]|nr:hypothetical protein [Noviherbaspirillum sp.]
MVAHVREMPIGFLFQRIGGAGGTPENALQLCIEMLIHPSMLRLAASVIDEK